MADGRWMQPCSAERRAEGLRRVCAEAARAEAAPSRMKANKPSFVPAAMYLRKNIHDQVPLVNSVIQFVKLEKNNKSAMAAACIACTRAPLDPHRRLAEGRHAGSVHGLQSMATIRLSPRSAHVTCRLRNDISPPLQGGSFSRLNGEAILQE